MSDKIEGNTVTVPLEFGPPKYQPVIPQKARSVLGCEGKRIIVEASLTVQKVVDEGGDA
jgi:hypothetical protein